MCRISAPSPSGSWLPPASHTTHPLAACLMTAGFGSSCLQVGALAILLLSGAHWNLSSDWIGCTGHPRVVTLLPTAVWVHTGPRAHTALLYGLSWLARGQSCPGYPMFFQIPTIYELSLVALVDDVLNFATILSLHRLKGKHTDLQQCLARRPGHRCFSSAFSPAFAPHHTLLHLPPRPPPQGEVYGRQVLLNNFVITAFSPLPWQIMRKTRNQLATRGRDPHLNLPILGKEGQSSPIRRLSSKPTSLGKVAFLWYLD